MSDENVTKPTLETVLERISDLRGEVSAFRASAEERLEDVEIRLDKLQSIALEARAEVKELKRDFRDFRSQFKQPA